MRTTRLVAALVGLLALAVLAADASAMYNPSTGTWLQRDPGPAGMIPAAPRIAGTTVAGAGFLPRDPVVGLRAKPRVPENLLAGQYRDGMNLYQYGQANPILNRDPTGLECGVTVRRINVNLSIHDLGHTWLNYPGNTMGFWPSGEIKWDNSADGHVARPDPDASKPFDQEWTTSRMTGLWVLNFTLLDGKGKGKDCRCATCDEIIDCMEKRGDFYGRVTRWSLLAFDCRTFVVAATNGCCLKIDGYWTW